MRFLNILKRKHPKKFLHIILLRFYLLTMSPLALKCVFSKVKNWGLFISVECHPNKDLDLSKTCYVKLFQLIQWTVAIFIYLSLKIYVISTVNCIKIAFFFNKPFLVYWICYAAATDECPVWDSGPVRFRNLSSSSFTQLHHAHCVWLSNIPPVSKASCRNSALHVA